MIILYMIVSGASVKLLNMDVEDPDATDIALEHYEGEHVQICGILFTELDIDPDLDIIVPLSVEFPPPEEKFEFLAGMSTEK